MQEHDKTIGNRFKNGVNHCGFLYRLFTNKTQRRHTLRWLRSLKQTYLFNTPSPWLVFDAIENICPFLDKGINVFEYGSGGSTLFWLKHGANVVSIEHDSQWYTLMKPILQMETSIDYRLIPPEIVQQKGLVFDPSDPESFFSGDESLTNYHFTTYVSQIDSFPDEYFNVILIDGRARPSCIKHSVNKVMVGGKIILDNADRDYYLKRNESNLENFSKEEFYGCVPGTLSFSKTNIYTRLK